MGFTRSTTPTDVHQNMPDYPSNEGYTTTQLKTAFDAPATGLKDDINNLEAELEASDAAESVGAAPLSAGDTSDANVQAKLVKLLTDMQSISQGAVSDGSITQAKMDDTYEGTLAKKNGNLQTGLNAEMLGGTTLAGIQALIAAQSHEAGTFTVSYTDTDVGNYKLNLGYNPRLVIYLKQSSNSAAMSGFPVFGVIIGGKGIYYDLGNDNWRSYDADSNSTGVTIKEFRVKSGNNTYTHNMSYIALK